MNASVGSDVNDQKQWHTLTTEQVAQFLDVDSHHGLASAQAAERLSRFGPNELEESEQTTLLQMLVRQFSDVMILILLAAAAVSAAVGEERDALVILIIVALNAVIGVVQEYRAEQAMAALRRMASPEARVRRDGHLHDIPATALVKGDVVVLEAGNIVPCDLRLFEVANIEVDEAAITGESLAVEKAIQALDDTQVPLGDRRNMAYKGTNVTRGRALGIAVATGMQTELGRIAALLEKSEIQLTPLQQRLARFSKKLAIAVLIIATIVFVVGLMRGEALMLMFLTAVSLAVAAIPEALPAVITISLALGAKKLGRLNALMRRLPAVETLGSVTYICSDKTGTLTRNEMRLETIAANGQNIASLSDVDTQLPLWNQLAKALALSTDVALDANGRASGDPTEIALYLGAVDAAFDKFELEQQHPRLAELSFTSERRSMTTLHKDGDSVISFTKGAPEAILSYCKEQLFEHGAEALDEDAVLAQVETMAGQGCRVLAVAVRRFDRLPELVSPEETEDQLSFLGLVGMIDPPRDEAREAVADCKTAGIFPVMITGDHPVTAHAIAKRLGMVGESNDEVITGIDLGRLSDNELKSQVKKIKVYARVSPEQKIRIVEALQCNGEFVAMTGDGVNDAPALKQADIGVAMGKKGTDVAREASDMVLVDDNFATIVNAVREGRRIFDNIRKFIKYTMTSNSGEIWTLFLAPFFGLPIPLLPIHILWINLVTDGLPGLAMSVEPREKGIMQRPPRPPNESIFAHGMWQHMVWVGLLIGGLSLAGQAWAYHGGSDNWQTVVFTVLTFSQLVQALVIRSERDSLFSVGLLSNLPLLGAVILTVGLQLMVIYVPFFNVVFHTSPLTLTELLVCFSLPMIVFVAVEIEKLLVRRGGMHSLSVAK